MNGESRRLVDPINNSIIEWDANTPIELVVDTVISIVIGKKWGSSYQNSFEGSF